MDEHSTSPPRQAALGKLSDTNLQSLSDRHCADLITRWQRGERVPVEAYLRQYPELEVGDNAFELVLTEIILRKEYGEPAPLPEYLWRFPQFEERLRRHFLLHAGLTTSAGQTLPGTSPPQTPPDGFVPPHVPAYEILGELGRGGMGIVYKARDTALGRQVALKFLPAEYARDPARLERFLREARTASALNHPHICTVHALGDQQGQPFIVMELIEGVSLKKLMDRRPGIDEIVRLIRQVARALAVAHAAGVVHRDIKPENIMLRDDSYVKVVDFGLARLLPTLANRAAATVRDTDPSALLGTVAYMSPEQTQGLPAESASDVFALGIVIYELLTGKHPFAADSALGTMHAIANGRLVSPSRLNSEIPAVLDRLVEAMLHKEMQLRPTAAEVDHALAALADGTVRQALPPTPRLIVHRLRQLDFLRAAYREADSGKGSLVCVVGEAGIGKTTLVEDFLDELQASGHECLIARGHCSERLAGSEAYSPVIDALGDWIRSDTKGTVARLMRIVAPTWYSQISPAVVSPSADAGTGVDAAPASSQQAMLREFCTLVQEASRVGLVVFFFDDVHWADISTVDLLAHFGGFCRDMRALVVVTHRQTEMLLGPHPFQHVKQELQARGACSELAVDFLGRADVDRYLALAFPGHAFPAEFVDLVYARTEGSPLFMVNLLKDLRERAAIAEDSGTWILAKTLRDLRQELPESVRSMIDRKLERLDQQDRTLLSAACVQGHEFDSAVLAGALGCDAADVEERLQALDRIHELVRFVRESELPDRTLSLRYAFVHILYQQALDTNLQPSRRAALAAALARALAHHHGEGRAAIAAELACLYEVAREFARAAQHFYLATRNAARVFAHREAVALARRGLHLLEALPESAERARVELPLQTTLGMQLQITEGFAAPEARHAYTRARELCGQTPDPAQLFPILWGLWLFAKVRSHLTKAQEMADELLTLAQRQHDPNLALQAHQALGMTAFCRGLPSEAVAHVEQVSTLYDPERHRTHAFLFGQDPAVICKAYGAVALWMLGYADQAVQQSDEAIRMSRGLSPSSQAVAMHFAAMLHQLRRDPHRVRKYAEESCQIAKEHGFSFWHAGGNILRGWAQAQYADPQQGLELLQQGLIDWMATDSVTYQTYYLGLLADVLGAQGKPDEALRVLDEALALAAQTGEGLYEPELLRLRGQFLLQHTGAHAADCTAQDHFQEALVAAGRQQSLAFELRSAVSSARHPRRQAQAFTVLEDVARRCSEGFDSPDWHEACALLESSRGDGLPNPFDGLPRPS